MSVKRYTLTYDESDRALDLYCPESEGVELGEYVKAEDYDELVRQLTAYQIAKDNLELRLREWMHDARGTYTGPADDPIPDVSAQVY
jgi:hypothetical protein